MSLTNTEKREIEVLVRKEIKDFLNSSTLNQFENKMIETIKTEIKKGKIRGDINDIVTNIMKEFYKIMWTQRSFWEPTLKNVK
jgi:anti-sigma28 factor (negative regulator of flagellin synthesis)